MSFGNLLLILHHCSRCAPERHPTVTSKSLSTETLVAPNPTCVSCWRQKPTSWSWTWSLWTWTGLRPYQSERCRRPRPVSERPQVRSRWERTASVSSRGRGSVTPNHRPGSECLRLKPWRGVDAGWSWRGNHELQSDSPAGCFVTPGLLMFWFWILIKTHQTWPCLQLYHRKCLVILSRDLILLCSFWQVTC